MAKENEVCFYASVGNPDGFSQAVSMEVHAQSEYRIPTTDGSKRKIRVRKTTAEGQVSFVETIKFGDTADEFDSKPTTEEYYEAWLKAFGQPICNKIRYVFMAMKTKATLPTGEEIELPDMKFEIDVLVGPDGKRSKFCKVEVELDALIGYLKEHHPDHTTLDMKIVASSLPLGLDNIFFPDDEEGKKAEKLFWDEFAQPSKSSPAMGAGSASPVAEPPPVATSTPPASPPEPEDGKAE